jgi:hypothetical protein
VINYFYLWRQRFPPPQSIGSLQAYFILMAIEDQTLVEEALIPGQSTAASFKLTSPTGIGSVINRAVDLCYQGLKRRWVLLITALVTGGLLGGAFWLPQLPGQLRNDPTASTRWLVGVSSSYGTLGGLLRMSGMFDALHSPLLQLSLAILALILTVYLSDCLATVWRFHRLPTLLRARVRPSAAPIETMLPLAVYRRRQAAPAPPTQLQEQLQHYLRKRFAQIQTTQLESAADAADEVELGLAETESGPEWRLLATRNLRWLYLQSLGLLGALLALSAVWWLVLAGWSVTPPLLAPGDLYRYAEQNLELHYVAPTTDSTPRLRAKLATREVQRPVEQPTSIWLGVVQLGVRPGPPALLVRTSQGEADLERAGQSKVAALLGLVFPSVGNEESIVLRKQAVGLRIVRTARTTPAGDLSDFLVELYRGKDAKPEQIKMKNQQRQTIPIDKQVTLELMWLPSLAVTASYLPGRWLLWVAPLLCLIGGVGFVRRPAYLLIQLSPWPERRSVVVTQSNLATEIEQLQGLLGAQAQTK